MLSSAQRGEVIRLAVEGHSRREIARLLSVPEWGVRACLRPFGGTIRRVDVRAPVGRGLTLNQRIEIADGLRDGLSLRLIGLQIGRHPSNVSREITANGGRDHYRPFRAHRRAVEVKVATVPAKLDHEPLRARVVADLEKLMSPEQIAGRLRVEYPNDPAMQVSHETIYKTLYVHGRGALARELNACLRTGRTIRKQRGIRETRGRIPDMVMIADRPAEIEDRVIPGHWEGDLILGANNASAIGTLVERTTRYVILFQIDGRHTAEIVRDALTREITRLPSHLTRSLTWDQGKEMAQHAQFAVETGIDVYFCDPHSPWQRGTNENTNGLLRQYFPKGTDLSAYNQAVLDTVAHSLNNRPRKSHGYATPAEKLNELLRNHPHDVANPD
jgi:transposase, IS30 family